VLRQTDVQRAKEIIRRLLEVSRDFVSGSRLDLRHRRGTPELLSGAALHVTIVCPSLLAGNAGRRKAVQVQVEGLLSKQPISQPFLVCPGGATVPSLALPCPLGR
jgi:hypothetical protein